MKGRKDRCPSWMLDAGEMHLTSIQHLTSDSLSIMSAVVEIENLTKDYEVGFWRKRKVRALDGLSLDGRGRRNIRLPGRKRRWQDDDAKAPDAPHLSERGRASILGRDINDVSMHARIGYLPENPYFYDYLTAREFVEYCAELFGYDKAQAQASRA